MASSEVTRAQLCNFYAASVLSVLAGNFPVIKNYTREELGFIWQDAMELNPNPSFGIEIFFGTLQFLIREGYVSSPYGAEKIGSYGQFDMVLTEKGLMHLNFRFTRKGLFQRRPLSEALTDAVKKPGNWIAIASLLEKVFK